MILLDGKKISQKILTGLAYEARRVNKKIRLAIINVGDNLASRKFIDQKKKAAKLLGTDIKIYDFIGSIGGDELRHHLVEIVGEPENTGVIVQLPLPVHINTQYILDAISPGKDVDLLSGHSLGELVVGQSVIDPPVVGAVKVLFREYDVDYRNKYVVVVGAGSLVGKPVALWLLREKITFSVVEEGGPFASEFTKRADILVSGVGKPRFITGDMVKEGVVIVDAGTSESGGQLMGDVDFESVAKKASYITPVPGGVGPLTVAMLFKNLVELAAKV